VKFLDINTFYGPKAGGIRTYHQAKMEWFSRHPEHEYILVFPADKPGLEKPFANVTLIGLYGPGVTQDPQGYRLLLAVFKVLNLIRIECPDVIESGDPWLTGPMTLILYRLRLFKGLLGTFYHSDPIPSYFVPWAEKAPYRAVKRLVTRVVGSLFYRLQAAYPLTVTSSQTMFQALKSHGVHRVACLPFGVAPHFFEVGASPKSGSLVRLLYAGRLDAEKGWDVLMPRLTELLCDTRFSLTVAGRGRYGETLAAMKHGRYRFHGFVNGVLAMAELYQQHDILLAPGPYETFGLGVLEAMASGIAVIGPNAGGTGELLREAQSTLVFEAGNGADFMAAIDRAATMDLTETVQKQRRVAQGYGNWDDAMGRLAGYYGQALTLGHNP
jgi:alpha-1,6-mannosyltransferase